MKRIISILITLLVYSLLLGESKPTRDAESNVFMNIDDNMLPLIISSHNSDKADNKYTISSGGHKHPKHPKNPKHSKRAYVHFTDPPELTKGLLIFWETRENTTLIFGQFESGFVEGKEKDYSFKVFKGSKEIVDLKPDNESLDALLKIRPNGSTDPFLFSVNTTLISGNNNIVKGEVVISKPDTLIGKNRIFVLHC
ncbi:10255_t:CDS:1 [Funneliformis geosporum]|uniref:9076_t:CDS:1 n=1 Tax=Funneliformis geosporum TaxID=1117311 RepID=A0A9W4SJ78_9GLOM|nr:9076_t:CDS:1 [Funneliformis geosporum]CAI2172038.1 10255_t:CDS:1 [Funneliformis geosporum]